MKLLISMILLVSFSALAKGKYQNKMTQLFGDKKISKLTDKGDFEVGGWVGMNNNDSSTSTNLTADFQYFVMDKLSAGVRFANTNSSYSVDGFSGSSSATSIGPTASYYFWENNRMAAFGGQSLLLQSGSAYDKTLFIGDTRVGTKYFLTRNVAFAGSFALNYALNESSYGTSTGIDGLFSIHF